MLPVTSYFSVVYLAAFLPAVVILYGILPQKPRRVLLLLSGYLMFWLISGKLLVYLLLETLLIHYVGLWLASAREEGERQRLEAPKECGKAVRRKALGRQRLILAFGVLTLIGILLVLKYGAFFITNFNRFFSLIEAPVKLDLPAFVLPIGISFYTMQAVSYLFDVHRKKIPADTNLFRLALYLSFFPQLMEGPICRYSETASQLWEAPALQWNNFLLGMQRILWGLLKKVVVADRLNQLIQNVFNGYQNYDGFAVTAAAVCYTIQLYMDFSGMMDLVMGTGQIFGITLPENFRQPFFSKTISEFWKRWHITLGTWFRDYIFYPLSFSGPLKKLALRGRKRLGSHYGVIPATAVALFSVWLCNGLWHGAGWNYIFFGMYHFALILMGNLIKPPVLWLTGRFHIDRTSAPYRGMQIVRTAVLVCIGELFFRANGLRAGLAMVRSVIHSFSFATLRDQSFFSFGADQKDYLIVLITLLMILIVSILHERGVSIRKWAAGKSWMVRFGLLYFLILYIVVFGAYGDGYVPVDPIYAGF